jgi:hypothetical protein
VVGRGEGTRSRVSTKENVDRGYCGGAMLLETWQRIYTTKIRVRYIKSYYTVLCVSVTYALREGVSKLQGQNISILPLKMARINGRNM